MNPAYTGGAGAGGTFNAALYDEGGGGGTTLSDTVAQYATSSAVYGEAAYAPTDSSAQSAALYGEASYAPADQNQSLV
jgi:hypothetical protein